MGAGASPLAYNRRVLEARAHLYRAALPCGKTARKSGGLGKTTVDNALRA